jgi:hypothetical protein
MSFICLVHPCSFAANAFARRAAGMRSKPDSVTVSRTPSGLFSISKETRVVGSAV